MGRKVVATDDIAVLVLGDLACYEDEPAPRRDDNMGVGLRPRQAVGIDSFERHASKAYSIRPVIGRFRSFPASAEYVSGSRLAGRVGFPLRDPGAGCAR